MFTGIITALGTIAAIEIDGPSLHLTITVSDFLAGVKLGDSIAVNGCCLTVTEFSEHHFKALLSAETLMKTTFDGVAVGMTVNLEKALLVGEPLGGHWVTGHVDGQALVTNIKSSGTCREITFLVPNGFEAFIAPKGSIAVDGVSLTVNHVHGCHFTVMLIEHTLSKTIAENYKVGTKTNFEIDMMARYVNQYHKVTSREVADVDN
ncbi:MAG: riboflavin synthase [Legionellales bacterium]|nr:riboflavin synthase [Legionellales bacterium]|tara:strand:- start:850 stop:1467 length:618 start_codon:yes stop_codon:yes gene_type:complete